jgi:hypothetical protein
MPEPSSTATTTTLSRPQNNPADLASKISLVTLVAAPLLAALPPRKLDLYTLTLATTFVLAANHQTKVQTGSGILTNIYFRRVEQQNAQKQQNENINPKEEEINTTGVKGMVRKVWMGSEKSDWKEKRMLKEKEAEEEGKGIGDVIWEQVLEVWGVEKRKKDDSDNEDGKKD